MRDQYAGDASDVLKFAFLRALAGADKTLWIAWYDAPGDDGRADGRHLEWRDEPAWERLDPELHVGLSTLSERSIAALERPAIWPKGCRFHSQPMPSRQQRRAWGDRKRAALDSADIVYLDLTMDLVLRQRSTRHLRNYGLRKPGRAIVFITFPGRNMPHDVLVQRLHERLSREADAENAITLRTNISVPRAQGSRSYVPLQRWFTVVDPDETLVARARLFAKALDSVPRVKAQVDGAP